MSTMLAPVATITSTILYLIKSAYKFIQPAELVLPAKVNAITQSLSFNIFKYISDALPSSLEVNPMFFICSMIGVESKLVISICLMCLLNISFFVVFTIIYTAIGLYYDLLFLASLV